ncbi:MAG: hypothetical protein VX944_06800 [Myxococcota bacterium]|jgi:hypothetical protein|nr:hypothetical protein [Myxococcota bacterium]MEC9389766.1 hypothetical protein [Myxococcota bacterium]
MSIESSPARITANPVVSWFREERRFLAVLGLCSIVAIVAAPTLEVAMWVGFFFAAYSAIANDSIQTIGTFIASNQGRQWWQLWLYIGGIFLATMAYSWFAYDGDVSHQRLTAKGFERAPEQFHVLQLIAPLALILLTRLRMPVSTTFLLLSCFATSGKGLGAVVTKSISGYGIAFVCSLLLWGILGTWMDKKFRGEAHPGWRVAQWITTGCLWSVWLQQDAANIAVYLPRSLDAGQLVVFLAVPFIGLGLLFKMGGEKIQEVVNEKASVVDVRAATVIDFLYAVILYIFKIESKVPMSTTWVFVGLLAGRELSMTWRRVAGEDRTMAHAIKLVVRDLTYVTIGFGLSLAIAAVVNPAVGRALFEQ